MLMMQHRNIGGAPIALKTAERFSDRMRRIAAKNLKEASMEVAAMNPESARWYCLQVTKGREFSVQDDLKGAGAEVFLPTERVTSVVRGTKIERDDIMFPQYIFVRCIGTDAAISGLARQRYVHCVIGGRGGNAYSISDETINSFKRFIVSGAARVSTDKSWKQGDEGEIVTGPFAGFTCRLLAVKWSREAKARVQILTDGKSFEIESMPLAFLKRL